jgi:hydrogenase expression/formation protein HypE
VQKLIAGGIEVHCLRDCTRGGLATTLVEIARARGLRIHLDSAAIPVRDDVRGACEMLGLDPLYVANEGRFIAIVPGGSGGPRAGRSCARTNKVRAPCASARCMDEKPGLLTLRSEIGSTRILDMLSGEQLPRIC